MENMPLSYIFIFDVRDSAPMASSMSASWVEYIRDQCLDARVAFFFKQWGGFNKKKAGLLLDGRTYDDMPVVPG